MNLSTAGKDVTWLQNIAGRELTCRYKSLIMSNQDKEMGGTGMEDGRRNNERGEKGGR